MTERQRVLLVAADMVEEVGEDPAAELLRGLAKLPTRPTEEYKEAVEDIADSLTTLDASRDHVIDDELVLPSEWVRQVDAGDVNDEDLDLRMNDEVRELPHYMNRAARAAAAYSEDDGETEEWLRAARMYYEDRMWEMLIATLKEREEEGLPWMVDPDDLEEDEEEDQ